MTERVTVEQNGERFTLEVPDGTSDADIQSFLSQQSSASVTPQNETANQIAQSVGSAIGAIPGVQQAGQMLQQPFNMGGEFAAEANPAIQNIATQNAATAALKAAPGAANFAERLPGNIVKEAMSLGKVAKDIGTEGAKTLGKQFLETPVRTAADIAKAYAQGHATLGGLLSPIAGQTATQAAGTIGRGALGAIGSSITAPENAFMMPYNMAAYEQEKIRANPTAPQYQNNPYAQTVRGEAATQGRAGSANQMKAVANMPFGGVTPQERAMLEEDMRMKTAIRKKAFEKVMGPVAPGSF